MAVAKHFMMKINHDLIYNKCQSLHLQFHIYTCCPQRDDHLFMMNIFEKDVKNLFTCHCPYQMKVQCHYRFKLSLNLCYLY